VVHFYQSCRATTRALIAARHLHDEKFRHSPHWMRRAGVYLQLAEEHIRLAAA
jgi:aminoglycoside phosphotransferase family enzyme